MGRAARLLAIVSVAGGVPYAWFSEGAPRQVREKFRAAWSAVQPNSNRSPAGTRNPYASRDLAASNTSPRPLGYAGFTTTRTGGTITSLEEALRLDVNDRWVLNRWPRVSTILSDRTRKGLRVPLVTGSQVGDLAGSLSYYFDERGRVRRITFEGHTGDERPLVELAMQRFAMRREPSLGAGLYLTRWNGLPTNGLHVRHAPVVRDSTPYSQLAVRFEINRPDEGYSLSREFLQALDLEVRARR